ncbi:lysozyme inhibitor LprI family protein [Legionella fallonii]|uniref:Lysozyme inhibitor LprI-like N-terminal domain-containing protein n=1 Tax=Legionella fallonii LLAP-10 TaxID=1212491 RepID=A0A098G3H7_9GAMM|nr:lysozyme inhibitor LprI family protein [Legionella fallonii]CEG56040.1 conserved exported protein of unknown function [Legionella fallonii LLAP-10]
MKVHKIYFLVGLFFISIQLNAQKYEYTGNCNANNYKEKFEDCLDKEVAMYDKELNILYNRLSKYSSYKQLRKTERLWIKFKEEDCDYIANEVNGGKFYQFIYDVCLINKTKARIDDLKRSYFYSGWFKKNC